MDAMDMVLPMAILVQHRQSNKVFVVVGAGQMSSWQVGYTTGMLTVCCSNGVLRQLPVAKLKVIKVDGQPVAEAFGGRPYR